MRLFILLFVLIGAATSKKMKGNKGPDAWTDCSASCGGGIRTGVNQTHWVMPCFSQPCDIDEPEGCHCGNADILFLVDRSNSIKTVNYWKLKQFMQDVIVGYDTIISDTVRREDVRFAVVIFDRESAVEFDFNAGYTLADIDAVLLRIWDMVYEQFGGGTNTPAGLQLAHELLLEQGKPQCPQVVFIITDGRPTFTTHLETAIENINSLGRSVFVLGIGRVDELQIGDLVLNDESRVYSIDDAGGLPGIVSDTLEGICCNRGKNCTETLIGSCSAPCGPGEQTVRATCEVRDKEGNLISTDICEFTIHCCIRPCEVVDYCEYNPCGEGAECVQFSGYQCIMPPAEPCPGED